MKEFSESGGDNSNIFQTKIKYLSDKQGFKYIRKCRRDGNCFYRCFLFAIMERMT